MGSSSSGGETLAGTIRQERTSARSGKSLAKKKLQVYFENILPSYLRFGWIDFDDEKNVAQSRARMANANAATSWISNQIFSPDEIRRQAIADGMFTIPLPETLDRKSIEWPSRVLTYSGNKSKEGKSGSNEIGQPQAPSSGGHGEVKPQQVISRNRAKIEVCLSKAIYSGNQILGALINSVRVDKNDFPSWEKRFEQSVVGKSHMDLVSETVIDDTYNTMAQVIESSDWFDTVSVELAHLYVDDWNNKAETIVRSMMDKQAEQDFIMGKTDDIIPEPMSIEHRGVTNDLVLSVKKMLLEKIVPLTILVSEKSIIEDKSELDTTDITDNNNIKIARRISEKVYNLLPQIIGEVGIEIEKLLGEK
jgi:hypothetical protein